MNIKMFGLKDLVKFASASGDRKIDIFAPQVSTHVHAKFLSKSLEFYKSGDKFGWVKYWQMTFNLPKFPPPQFCTIQYNSTITLVGFFIPETKVLVSLSNSRSCIIKSICILES